MSQQPAPTWPPRRNNEVASAAARVAEIVDAAEQAAEELRERAEQRADDRIAEAERAAIMRVQAADDEALMVRDEASYYAQEARDKAATAARELLNEARAAARDVLREGELLSGHLNELADSLRTNAELLLRDIRDVHMELTARLDRADPVHWGATPGPVPAQQPAPSAARDPDLDVPEFIPRQ